MTRSDKRDLISIIAAALLLAVAALLPLENRWLSLVAYLVPYVIVGGKVVWKAVRQLFFGRVFDENLLMTIATVGAFVLGENVEAVAVMLFYAVGELFEHIAVGRSRRNIAALMDIRPDVATVVRDGAEIAISPDEVKVGEIIVVRPGEKIPLDGKVVEGRSSINTSALTGESLPRDIAEGDRAVSGTVNLSGVLKIQTESEFEQSTVARILELVSGAASKKSRSEAFITRFSKYYTPAVVIGALALALIPSAITGDVSKWVSRGLVFLVVSCPCALVISVPLSFFSGIGRASRRGILIKGSGYLDGLSRIKTVVFDKTGTLTKGEFEVSAVSGTLPKEEILALAASAEVYSNHPIARSIVRAAGDRARKPIDVRELSGLGVIAEIDGKKLLVGNERLMKENNIEFSLSEEVGTSVYVACDGEYLGCITVADRIKDESRGLVVALKKTGIQKTVMLTGDRAEIGEAVAKELSVDEAVCSLLPEGKVEAIERLLTPGKISVAFVGDGINDAPVLTRADIGIAMGAMGSDAAIEAADIVLMDDNPAKIPEAIALSRRVMRIVKQNIVFAISVKLLVLALSAFGLTGMWLAIFADVGVAVLAILNAMRA